MKRNYYFVHMQTDFDTSEFRQLKTLFWRYRTARPGKRSALIAQIITTKEHLVRFCDCDAAALDQFCRQLADPASDAGSESRARLSRTAKPTPIRTEAVAVPAELKAQAAVILSTVGLSLADVFESILAQIVDDGGLPAAFRIRALNGTQQRLQQDPAPYQTGQCNDSLAAKAGSSVLETG